MWQRASSRRRGGTPAGAVRGFTLIELVIVVAIVGILAAAAMPLARWSVKRAREHELQQSLRILRTAIDRYHDAAAAGLIEVPEGASGYPPSLDVLVQGVPLIQQMPSPVPSVASEYTTTGAGLTGGLQALMQQQQAAAGGAAGLAGGTGASGPGQAGPGLQGSPGGVDASGRPTPGFIRRGTGTGGFGSSFGQSGGSSQPGSRPSPFANRPSPFADRPSVFEAEVAAAADGDVDGEGGAGQPILGADGEPVLLKFLRRLPVDPMTGEAEWGLRCYGEQPEDRLWCGTDVFDVYSKSLAKAIDGTAYKDW